jgi:N-succinyl-L-ornithine transcarbamylase
MKQFISVNDVPDVKALLKDAFYLKKDPFHNKTSGTGKTMGILFLNPSLRTRMSTQKAATNLGMHSIVMNIDKEGWALEMEDGTVMNGNGVEHIKDAAAVIGQFCDIIGIRCFPLLKNREDDYNETILNKFIRYSGVPVVNLESATLHPLQSMADLMTIEENRKKERPKIVLSWSPHIRALPQAVPNSFAQWMNAAGMDLVITHPQGYELAPEMVQNAKVEYDQQKALEGADFVYVKNWSSYRHYGQVICIDASWMLTEEKLHDAPEAFVMHCLPVRRNLEVTDELLDGKRSLILQQAGNRVWAAQAVIKNILSNLP